MKQTQNRLLLCANRNTAVDQEGRRCMKSACKLRGCDGVFRNKAPLLDCFKDLEAQLNAKEEERERSRNAPQQLRLAV